VGGPSHRGNDQGLWEDSMEVWDMMQHQCMDFTIIVKCFFRFLEVNPLAVNSG